MNRVLIFAVALTTLALVAYGDSIDDAEAKRRGVPVAQVQAENALAIESRKAADLEKQIAALQNQLGDSPVPAAAPASAPATRAAVASASAPTKSAAGPATAPGLTAVQSALADEKRKTADLEQQVATLKKRLAGGGSGEAAAPATRAASAARAPTVPTAHEEPLPPLPEGVVRADDVLEKFPSNVERVAPKGKKVTIEGRYICQQVGDTRKSPDPKAAASMPFDAFLVRVRESDSSPGHITCRMDAGTLAQFKDIPYDSVIRITGTAGDVTEAMDRFELLQCDTVKVIAPASQSLESGIVGQWNGEYNSSPRMRGDFQFNADHSMSAAFNFSGAGTVTLPGTWRLPEGQTQPIDLKYVLQLDKASGPVELELLLGELHVPEIPPLYVLSTPFVVFNRTVGPRSTDSAAAARGQVLQWVRTNCVENQRQAISTKIVQLASETALYNNGGFSLVLDGQLTLNHKTTQIDVCGDHPFFFEYTDQQTTVAGLAAGTMQGKSWPDVKAGYDAVKIESVTLDGDGVQEAGKGVKGRITLRALTKGGLGESFLNIVCRGVTNQRTVNVQSLDSQTIDISLNPGGRREDKQSKELVGNPTVVYFYMFKNTESAGDRDSNVIAKLVQAQS